MIFNGNHVERTTFSGCQITTNDRFHNLRQGACSARRVKVIGNRFLESGADFEINGVFIRNTGRSRPATPGSSSRTSMPKRDGTATATTISPKRIIRLPKRSRACFPPRGSSARSSSRNAASAWGRRRPASKARFCATEKSNSPSIRLRAGKPESFKLSRILTDIEIIDNEILNSHVNGIYTNGVYRLRVINNKVFNCNVSDSQWTGTAVSILNGAEADVLYNWIQDNRTEKLHKKGLHITAADSRDIGNRIN